MGRYIGVDLGTTSITALLLDTASGRVLAGHTASNDAETTSSADRARARSEWDIDRMVAIAVQLLTDLVSQMADRVQIDGIGVTGQQHGMVLLDGGGRPITPFIGWQDRRCHDRIDEAHTYLERMQKLSAGGFARSEYAMPVRGYMGSTLFWLSEQEILTPHCKASFAADYLVSRLSGQPPVTDSTNAAGSGLFDVEAGQWHTDLIETLGLDASCLPSVHPSCTWSGALTRDMARRIGLPADTPIANACGDNQASFAGSVDNYGQSVLVNIGTGGQVSAYLDKPLRIDGLLLRPYLNGGYLLVGAGLTGGRSYAVLERFIRQIGTDVFGLQTPPGIYDRLNALAERVPPGADGLRCEPIFTGSLREPQRRGVWSGVSDMNFTPGHITRALLEGMAEQFHLMYRTMQYGGVHARKRLIGAGNGIRKNALLAHILGDAFHLPLHIVRHTEEAAFGAALCAAVAAAEFPDIETAGRKCIGYEQMSV